MCYPEKSPSSPPTHPVTQSPQPKTTISHLLGSKSICCFIAVRELQTFPGLSQLLLALLGDSSSSLLS